MNNHEIFVGMGELAVTADPATVLLTIGLGSCVGVALLDPPRKIAGLAHVIFPDSGERSVDAPGKYANTAVPALIDALVRLGAPAAGLFAVLVGGARMFKFERSLNLDVGARNIVAVHAHLRSARIPVRAEATGGGTGRSIRVDAAGGVVGLREGGTDAELYRAAAPPLARIA